MQSSSDVIIVGAGLVGSAMAIALAQGGVKVALFERASRKAVLDKTADGRASAISEASRRVFESIGIWNALSQHGEPILDIKVVDGFSDAQVHYDHKEVGERPFGYIISNPFIRASLIEAVEAEENIALCYESEVSDIKRSSSDVTVTLKDDSVHTASVLLAADGRMSRLREWAGIASRKIEYGQSAIVCSIKHEKPHGGLALERFLPNGPIAVLPMKDNHSCVVWTEPHDMAKHMIGLDDAFFVHEMTERMGHYLGEIESVDKRYCYPLNLMQSEGYIAERFALVGDSAHGIHPIAGQGVNLGYRDVAVLAELLIKAKRLGQDIGGAETLAHYQRWRRLDSTSMITATDALNRLFSNNSTVFKMGRRLGLNLVDNTDQAKQYFMLGAMGLLGDLPEMLADVS